MDRDQMIEALYALDEELESSLTIVITGASALILGGSINRSSNDIDLLGTSERLDKEEFKEAIGKVAKKYHLREDWINSRAEEGTFRDLPGFKPDLQELKTDKKFRFLQPFFISRADSVVTKFAFFENIRQWDKTDIRAMRFTDTDFIELQRKLNLISRKDPERALRIEVAFKSVKPEFIKTEDGFSFSNSGEVALYAKNRYGMILDKSYLQQIEEDVSNMRYPYEKAIIDIDNAAITRIVDGRVHGTGL